MTHVKDTGDVWRRDDHGKGRAFVRTAVEVSLTHPVFIPFLLGCGRNIVLAQFHDQNSILQTGWSPVRGAKIKKIPRRRGITITQFECYIRNRQPAYANQYSQDKNITKPMKPMASSAVFAVSPM
jgi:hypothetical protein